MSEQSQFVLLKQRRFLPFFLTQSLGAFNDNVFKQALIAMIISGGMNFNREQKDLYTNLAAGLFILPFFLFSATSGQISERFDKARIAQFVKLFEIAIMLVAAIGFIQHSIPLLLAMLFMMGLHSTIFGPLKYSLLPQILHREELVGGNGLVELGTFVAILTGSLLGASLVQVSNVGVYWVAGICIGIAIVGFFTAKKMPSVAATAPDLPINPNLFKETWNTLRYLRVNRTVFLSCLGISWFWFFGSIYFTQLPHYAESVLGGAPSTYSLLLSLFTIGVAIGSVACEKLSGHKVEIGLVPFGAIGMTLFGMDMYFAHPANATASVQTIAQVIQQPGVWRVLLDVFGMAVFSGFFIVPLFALVQSRTEPSHRSRVIVANNILNAAFMVVAVGFAVVMLTKLKLSIPQLFLATAILNAIVAIYIFTVVPEFLMRFLSWILINTLYRLEVEGLDQIPEDGPCLVVCNHVSFMDALIVGGSVRRPIRFVMDASIFKIPLLNFMFRTARAIPITSRKVNPDLLERAYAEVDKALSEGEVVGIFPEGIITHTGDINSFRPGIERILASRPVAVVPIALRGMWGSMFSRKGSPIGKHRLPRRFWSRIALVVGAPIPPDQANAVLLETKVRALRGDWA
jgi:1-acyl-sn-glycerol-3-phosphate acyltransferase